jgi:SAM-dependent methyltransferase
MQTALDESIFAPTFTDRISTVDEIFSYLQIDSPVLLTAARQLHLASDALGVSAHADLLRVDACHRIRLGQDAVFATDGDPTLAYAKLIHDAAAVLETNARLPLWQGDSDFSNEELSAIDATADHYGRLWGGFSPDRYFEEAKGLLQTRMERNGIDVASFAGKRAVDIGCGGGRYTVALKRLGFAEVIGCDWSTEALSVARLRAEQASVEGVSYQRVDVLSLPFNDNEFDFVFSNGVFHHTLNTEQCLREMIRVMKPSGHGWLYLYARPGGLDRLTHYLARLLLRKSNPEACRRYCRALGLAGNRVFFLLDLWLTPIAECYTPDEVEGMLERTGCSSWNRLGRGTNDDLVEHIYRLEPYAFTKYGVGENRYFFSGKVN